MNDFINQLAQFKHRLSGSKNNQRLALYLKDTFESFGFETKTTSFQVPGNLFLGIAINIFFLMFVYVFLSEYYLFSLILYFITLISIYGEVTFSFHLLRRLIPAHKTYNIETFIPAKNKSAKSIIVVAHHDSPKTGFIYNEKFAGQTVRVIKKLPPPFNRIFLLSFSGVFFLGIALILRLFLSPNIISSIMLYGAFIQIFITFIFVLQMVFSKPSPGANDNGSGLLVLLELAKRFSKDNPVDTNVHLLSTGAEELGFFGIRNYIKNSKNLVSNDTLYLNLECVGDGELHWAVGEEFLFKTAYSKKAVQAIEFLENNGFIPILPKISIIAPTDAGPLAKNNFNAVTLIGLNHGLIPANYHRSTDTFDKLNRDTLLRATDIIEDIIKNLNGRKGG